MPALQRALYEADALEQRRPCTRASATTSNIYSHALKKCPAVHKYIMSKIFYFGLFYWTALHKKKQKSQLCVCALSCDEIFLVCGGAKKNLIFVFFRNHHALSSYGNKVLRHSAKHLILRFTDENQTQARVNEEPSFFRRAFFNSHSTHHQTTVLHLNACSKLNG